MRTSLKIPVLHRRNALLSVVGIAVVAVAAVIGSVAAGSGADATPKPPGAEVGSQLNTTLPADIAHLPLVDEYGNPTNLAAFRGKVVVLTDFMTLCQEVCPITTAVLNEADKAVVNAGLVDKVAFVDVTIDPTRDTPAQLHAYRSFAHLLPNWTLLTGTKADITKLWDYFHVWYKKVPEASNAPLNWRTHQPLTYDIEHQDLTTFLDPNGVQRFAVLGMPDGVNAPLTSGERAFLSDEGQANLAESADSSWGTDQALQVIDWLTGKHLAPASN